MEALIRHLRTPEFGGQAKTVSQRDPVQRSKALHKMLQNASAEASMGMSNSTYVRPHVVRKMLLWASKQGLVSDLTHLSLEDLRSMQMPDENGYLDTVPSYMARKGDFTKRCSCPALLLSCYACLAAPALQQHPEALEVTRSDPQQVAAALTAYKAKHGFAPSLERLYHFVFAAPPQTTPAKPKQKPTAGNAAAAGSASSHS